MPSSNTADFSPDDIVIPPSSSTVSVKALIAFTRIVVPGGAFLTRTPGTQEEGPIKDLVAPGHSFLVEHPPTGRKIVFDLGIRKNREGHAPAMLKAAGSFETEVKKDVSEQLREGGVDLESIEAVIWRLVFVIFQP